MKKNNSTINKNKSNNKSINSDDGIFDKISTEKKEKE